MPDKFLALLGEHYKGEFFASHNFREIILTKLQLSPNMPHHHIQQHVFDSYLPALTQKPCESRWAANISERQQPTFTSGECLH